jgi:ribosomal protein S18 acetylase RimI-like enzyme
LVSEHPPSGYFLRSGSGLERSLLLKFLQKTYQELNPGGEIAHLAYTVEQYFSKETPLWWVEQAPIIAFEPPTAALPYQHPQPVGCLWLGNVIDQLNGNRHAHIFLIYVSPAHRRRGIGSALICHAENWAKTRGDRQIGLQVFQSNQPALRLYQRSGYNPQSLWMIKHLD